MLEAKTKFSTWIKIQPSSFNGVPLDLLKKDQNSDLIFKKKSTMHARSRGIFKNTLHFDAKSSTFDDYFKNICAFLS